MAAKEKTAKKATTDKKDDKPKMLGTKEVAAKLGISPTTLRRILRAAGKNTPGEYSRYEWKPDEDLSKLKKLVEEHTAKEGKKKKKAAGKKAAGKKKNDPPADTEELEGEEEEEEEEELA